VIASGQPLDDDLFTFLAHHVVVPAAVIAMVASLLWYLVDVRSAFLGGGPQLKWIGFCFAVATVLIERYGHSQVDQVLQGCYTAALGIATIMVMLAEPWESRSVGLGEKLANLLIIAAVWRFATKVTQGLSPEEGRPAWTAACACMAWSASASRPGRRTKRRRPESSRRRKKPRRPRRPIRPCRWPAWPPSPSWASRWASRSCSTPLRRPASGRSPRW